MTNKQRTDLIERHLREHKYADLHSLAQRFGGSLSTVRRILDGLEERGVVRRHHGGASLVEGDALARENDFLTRIQRQADRKFRIASVIAEQVAPGTTVILDGGSTTFAVARLLVEKFEEKVGPILTEEERNADIDTVGGLVFTLAGRVPARGEVISHPSGYEFRILDSDPRRIRRLRARRMDPIDAPPDGESPKPA